MTRLMSCRTKKPCARVRHECTNKKRQTGNIQAIKEQTYGQVSSKLVIYDSR